MTEHILTYGGNVLLDKLMQIPPDLPQLKAELDSGIYTAEDITTAAIQYLDNCFDEQVEESLHKFPADPTAIPALHSTHIFDLVQLLLDYGLNPNAVYGDSNVMWSLQYIDHGYLAADTLALLLEHGGNVNLQIDGEDLFGAVDFSVMFDALNQKDRHSYDALVHFWFVCLGYGAALKNKASPVDVVRGFDMHELRNHRNFTFGLSRVPCRGKNWSLHIFDKRTLWEVARL